jgi:hypothetical protein
VLERASMAVAPRESAAARVTNRRLRGGEVMPRRSEFTMPQGNKVTTQLRHWIGEND